MSEHSVTREGLATGLIGGVVVAIWFLLRDGIAGHPFLTPNILGQFLLFGDSTPSLETRDPGAIAGFLLLHFPVFVGLGILGAWLVHQSQRWPIARIGIVIVFAAIAVFMLGFAQTLSEQVRMLFPAWSALIATLLGGLSMGWFLWRRHPRLRSEVDRVPVGDSDE